MQFVTLPLCRATVAVTLIAATMSYVAADTGLVAEGCRALDADNVDEALVIFEKAVAARPNDPAALAWLGNAQVRKTATVPFIETRGWFQKGFETMDQAVARFPDAFVVYLVRGNTAARVPAVFGGKEKAHAAIKDLNVVIDMHAKNAAVVPDSAMPSVYLGLGLGYKHSGDPAAARAAWERGKALYPAAPETKTIDKELAQL
jgi:tetratricopeptide (TPR) repeat protein